MKGGKGDDARTNGTDDGATGTCNDDILDPAVRDALIKRAEAEALQVQRDHEITIAKTQAEEEEAVKKQSVKTTVPDLAGTNSRSIKPHSTANQQKQKHHWQATKEANQAVDEIDDIKKEHKNSGIMKAQFSNPQQSGQLSFFSKKEAAIPAGGIPVKGLPTAEDNDITALMQIAAEINENAKMEKFTVAANYQEHNYNTPMDDLMQMATELNENAKMEKIANASNSMVQPEVTQQRPGAYMGVPGEALQRANNLRLSLVGASTTGPDEPLVQMDDEDSSTLLQTNDEMPTSGERQLAVANLVLEDEDEEKNMPAAAPVDLQQLQEREQTKKRQKLMFFVVAISLFIVAAATVGAVVRTQNQREPEVVVLPSTASPTEYGSMTPSEVPSSAPTGALDLLLDSLPDNTVARMNNGSDTPQWKAWRWVAEHQNITFLPEWRKTQLFALATFFYAFEGDNWNPLIKGHGWMDDTVEECDWFSSGFGYFDWYGKYREWYGGTAPCDELGQFTSLDLADLDLLDHIPSIPPEISLLTSLSRLLLNNNDFARLTASFFPAEFFRMTALTSLWFAGNQLLGPVPSELALLTALVNVDLSDNRLTGLVPSELGLLTFLERLHIDQNELTHLIPFELGLLTSLDNLDLSGNRLTGPFPSELGLLTLMQELNFGENQLTGTVPSEIGKMTALNWFELDQNQFTGPFPSELCS
ncbi:expressed unknown protein [Seminavis robusta]|uniref:L domain-like protein n=1 Tax=Seminavis robusta TaxID=568900 RepID=A0A9N8EIC0_9STRA|nr:expressed unknown protein [Seminavis robusta]|eukprot:Sro1181_g249831.1  (702) ;mRNA; r:11013-13118